MRKLLIIGLSTVVLGSCTTPMERAQDTCRQMGNPSSSCVERQFNIERAWMEERYQQRMEQRYQQRMEQQKAINSGSPPSPSVQPTESEYDRRGRESREEFKSTCEQTGGVYEFGNDQSSCSAPKPKVPSQPRENEKCRNYARRAIRLYQEATSPLAENRGCNVQINDPTWNPNYQTHYNWCLKAQDAWLRSEDRARIDYLYDCNRPHSIDQGTNAHPAPDD